MDNKEYFEHKSELRKSPFWFAWVFKDQFPGAWRKLLIWKVFYPHRYGDMRTFMSMDLTFKAAFWRVTQGIEPPK